MHDQTIESILKELRDVMGCDVVALYRETYAHDFCPAVTVSDLGIDPPGISSASDLAATLRRAGENHVMIEASSTLDKNTFTGFKLFDIKILYSFAVTMPLRHGGYHMTMGFKDPDRRLNGEEIAHIKFKTEAIQSKLAAERMLAGSVTRPQADEKTPLPFVVKSIYAITQRFLSCETQEELANSLFHALDLDVVIENMEGIVVASRTRATSCGPDARLSTRAHVMRTGRVADLERLDFMNRPLYLTQDDGSIRCIFPISNMGEHLGLLTVITDNSKDFWRNELVCQNAALVASLICSNKGMRRQTLLRNTLNASEAERVRMASSLQDKTSQNLVALKVLLSCAEQVLTRDPERAQGILEDAICVTDDILASINRVTADLRPNELDYLGLATALETYAERKLAPVGCGIEISGNAKNARFDPLMELTILRVAQEAIRNVAKHSGAGSCKISLDVMNGYLELAIRDDGCGFDVSKIDCDTTSHKNYGMKTMRDKVDMLMGTYWVGSRPGKGTTVNARIPV